MKIIIKQAVAIKGKHYPESEKPVSIDDKDANYLLTRGIATLPAKKDKAEKDEG